MAEIICAERPSLIHRAAWSPFNKIILNSQPLTCICNLRGFLCQRPRNTSLDLQDDPDDSASTSKVVGVLTIEDIIEELLQTEVMGCRGVVPSSFYKS